MLLQEIYKELIIEEVSINKITDAINNTYEVEINYHSNGEDIASGKRIIQPVAYGLTKAGNPVIRAFQPYGDTTTKVPSWKFFRVDRISSWKGLYNNKFNEPPGEFNAKGDFNADGDKSMSIVYTIAKFNNKMNNEPEIYKTDTERGLEHLAKQLENPTYISDIIKNKNFGPVLKKNKELSNTNKRGISKPNISNNAINNNSYGPLFKNNDNKTNNEPEIYKTDTERGLEHLAKQLENPTYISDVMKDKKFGPSIKTNDIGPKLKDNQ